MAATPIVDLGQLWRTESWRYLIIAGDPVQPERGNPWVFGRVVYADRLGPLRTRMLDSSGGVDGARLLRQLPVLSCLSAVVARTACHQLRSSGFPQAFYLGDRLVAGDLTQQQVLDLIARAERSGWADPEQIATMLDWLG